MRISFVLALSLLGACSVCASVSGTEESTRRNEETRSARRARSGPAQPSSESAWCREEWPALHANMRGVLRLAPLDPRAWDARWWEAGWDVPFGRAYMLVPAALGEPSSGPPFLVVRDEAQAQLGESAEELLRLEWQCSPIQRDRPQEQEIDSHFATRRSGLYEPIFERRTRERLVANRQATELCGALGIIPGHTFGPDGHAALPAELYLVRSYFFLHEGELCRLGFTVREHAVGAYEPILSAALDSLELDPR
jgi:hypothetical protein